MGAKLDQLRHFVGELADLQAALHLLDWDQQTYMPAGGSPGRGQQLAALGKVLHQKATAPQLGELLQALKAEQDRMGADSDESAFVRVAVRDYDRAVRVPADFVAEHAVVTAAAFQAWRRAKSESDFGVFRPHLERVVDLARRYVTFFPQSDHPYDVLLEDYEPGMKTAEVQSIFGWLRPRQVELVQAIAGRPQANDGFLRGRFSERKIWDFSAQVSRRLGYDWDRGRMDRAPHPFATAFGRNDVRITNRYEADNPLASIFSAMHEAGHAMYEQGIASIHDRTSLAHGASLAVHESQSRLWENLIGRSLAFWEYMYPRLKQSFPSPLQGVGLKSFYRAINKVRPSLIRVNADEATYNLHIMLRLELEIMLIGGALEAKDLPSVWNAKMQEFLGVTPRNDAEGVLQDVHWSSGLLGYFSTYALGNLISAQVWERLQADVPTLERSIRAGDFDVVLEWLREKIHKHGRKYDPQDLVRKVTGSVISPEPYMRYLTEKYSQIYSL